MRLKFAFPLQFTFLYWKPPLGGLLTRMAPAHSEGEFMFEKLARALTISTVATLVVD